MPKSQVFKDTANVLSAAFPVLLKGLKEVSDAIPTPVGPLIKGVVQTTLYFMTKVEECKTTHEDIYLLSARSAQVVTTIVNECQRGNYNPDMKRNLEKVNLILKEISLWVQRTVTTDRVGKLLLFLKPDDTIKEVGRLNLRLNDAIALFGLENQISTQNSLSDIEAIVESTKNLMANIERRLKNVEMTQFIEKRLFPRIETLAPSDDRCLPGTRNAILDDIKAWLPPNQHTSNITSPSIYWLTGVAGSGKSTVSRSVIEITKERRLACSWFYFSREYANRRSSDHLMTIVAHDLISSGDLVFIREIHDSIDRDKIDGSSPLTRQMEGFLQRPVQAANRPVVIIWDGLDECTETTSRRALLALLGALPNLPSSTKIFLTSRRESDLENIREGLGKIVPMRHRDLTFNPRDEHDFTLHDIDAYIKNRFEKMPGGRKSWLSSNTLDRLEHIIDGLFMIAQFVCNLIDHHLGHSRLESLLEEPKYGEGGSTTERLYFWYRTGLEHLFREDTSREVEQAKAVMATILVVQYPLSGKGLATLLGFDEVTTNSILNCLSPFLVPVERKTKGAEKSPHAVRFIHESILDFLVSDKAGKFRIDRESASTHLAVPCLQILHDGISEAFRLCCSSSSPQQSGRSEDIQESHVSEALAYACRFWGYHMKEETMLDENLERLINDLFISHLLEWLYLMGRLDALDTAISCLYWIKDWKLLATRSNLVELVSDSIRFVRAFSYPLRTYTNTDSPSLHFTPKDTLLYQTYSKTRSRILRGIPNNWPPFLSALEGHKGSVTSIALSSDGRRIISGSADRTVRLWDASTGKPLGPSLQGHIEWVTCVAFSYNGKRIASGSIDKTVRIWNVSTGKASGSPLEGHMDAVRSIAFSPDGTRVVSGSYDRTLRIWNVLTGKQVGSPLEGHTNWVRSVAFSPDGKYVVSGSYDTTLRIWDVSTGHPLGKPMKGHTDSVRSVAFSPDGKHIVSGSIDKTVRVWDMLTRKPLGAPLEGHMGVVTSAVYSPDGKFIISGSYDRTVRVWEASTGQPFRAPLKGHKGWVTSVSSDGNSIVSGSNDMTVRIWDTSAGGPLEPPPDGHTSPVQSFVFSPDGKHIVSGSIDKTLRIWDASSGEPLGFPLKGHTRTVLSVAFSSDGKRIVSGSVDRTLRVWDMSIRQPLGPPMVGHTHSVTSVAFSPDGRRIVSGSYDMTVRVWDASTGTQLGQPLRGHTDLVTFVMFSPDGESVISRSHGKTIRWELATGQSLVTENSEFPELKTYDLLPDGWLKTLDGRQLCWLPSDYRDDIMAWSETSQCFAVGSWMGFVTIIKTD